MQAGVFLTDPHQPRHTVLHTGRGEIGRKMVEQGQQAMADLLAMAVENARLTAELEEARREPGRR
jgi:hypothetical protein